MKKAYKAPTVESHQIQEPLAYACNIYNAESFTGGCWTGTGVSSPTFICGGDEPCVC
jgi:hypothetical protein